MRILLIEDDSSMAKIVNLILMAENYHCDSVGLGVESLEMAKVYNYDLIILDLVLPDMGGYDVLRELRASNVTTPVLILSGLNDVVNKTMGLGYGADDYLTKPFNRSELIARSQAIIRRSKGHASPILHLNKHVVVNTERRVVEVKGEVLALTAKEYAIIEFLAISKGKVLSKEMFLNVLYGGMDEPEAKIVDVFICKVRKKLSEAIKEPYQDIIETIWGRGYMVRNDVDMDRQIEKEEQKVAVPNQQINTNTSNIFAPI